MSDFYTLRETYTVYDLQLGFSLAWKKRGGSFVRNLGEALAHADAENSIIILTSFPKYIANYEEDALKFIKSGM